MLNKKEFDKRFWEALKKIYPEQVASGKIRRTKDAYIGIKFKDKN